MRKPYILISDHERDPVVRGVMNLTSIKIQYSEDQVCPLSCAVRHRTCSVHSRVIHPRVLSALV